jgi:hypothetical protein
MERDGFDVGGLVLLEYVVAGTANIATPLMRPALRADLKQTM